MSTSSIAIPPRQILLPRFEFPAFLRNLKDDAVSKMRSPLGGAGQIGGALGVGRGAAVVANWWEAGGATGCVAAYQPKGAASLAASYVNLANPGTYDAALGIAPTLSNGWVFNGSAYLNTGIVPTTLNWTALLQFTGASTSLINNSPFGATSGTNLSFAIQFARTGSFVYGIWSYNGKSIPITTPNTPQLANGNYGFAGLTPYRNGIAEPITIESGGGPPTHPIWIGGYNNSGSLIIPMAFSCIAFVVYNNILSAGQVASVAAAMAAL